MSELLDGLLVVDKPGGMTSRDAANRVQRWFPRGTKIGHTGTLDPLATGVLVLCIGRATRLAEYVQRMGKTYESTFRLGVRSDTDDADGVVTLVEGVRLPPLEEVRSALGGFIGTIEQVPPAYSAVKVTGQRAHDLARRGEEPALTPRTVRIDRIDIRRYEPPELDVEVHCGKGTYIRSIARDLGARFGCGGLVQTLRRTRVGVFSVDRALSLNAEPEEARKSLLPMALAVSELPRLDLHKDDARRLRQGQSISGEVTGEVAAYLAGQLVAVIEGEGQTMRPVKVLG